MNSTLASLFSDLDAMTYFFVNSGIFVGIIAGTFLFIGLLFGLLTWGRYRRRWLQAEEVVESLKSEVATLKRRLTEQSTRPLVSFNQPRTQLTLAPLPMPTLHFPVGHMFCVWMEPEWKPPVIKPQPVLPSKAFSLWTEPDFKPRLGIPPSRAFSLWIEDTWTPPSISKPPLLSSRAFTIWTEKDWSPAKREFFPSLAFSLWTEAHWTPAVQSAQKAPASAAHCVWTEADWTPIKRPFQPFSLWTSLDWEPTTTTSFQTPASAAHSIWTEADWTPIKRPFQPFSLWTSPDWEPTTTTSFQTPASQAFCIWTEEGWEPPKPMFQSSKAHSLWTQNGWMPAPIKPQKLPASRAYSLWTEAVGAPSVAAIFSKTLPSKETSRVPTLAALELAMLPQGPTTVPSSQMMASMAASVKSVSSASRNALLHTTTNPAELSPAPPAKSFFSRVLTTLGIKKSAAPLQPSRESIIPTPPPALIPKVVAPPIAPLDKAPATATTPIQVVALVAPNITLEPVTPSPIHAAVPIKVLPMTDPAPGPLTAAPILPIPALETSASTAPITEPPPMLELVDASPLESLPPLPEAPPVREPSDNKPSRAGLAYIDALFAGSVRNDLLLGILYQAKPQIVDDLTELKGVAETLQSRLNETGIYTYKQIALWSLDQAREFSSRLSFKDRVEREHWVDQAKELHFKKYGEKL